MKRWHLFRLAIAIVAGALIIQFRRSRLPRTYSVEDRLRQFAAPVRDRLGPAFEKAGISYPPTRLVLAGFKAERRLELYAAGQSGPLRFIKSYPVQAASGTSGPKLREGDRQVPEGLYQIEYLNPNSSYHLSMKVSYPNTLDRARAEEEGRTQLGGDIMIHGRNVSIGCLAMGDPAAEELFVLAALVGVNNIEVILAPVDFRTTATLPDDGATPPPWAETTLYPLLRRAVAELPSPDPQPAHQNTPPAYRAPRPL